MLKISGEALQNGKEVGTDHNYVHELCKKITKIAEAGHQIVIVNGGGNICRGEEFAQHGIAPTTSHGIGMLATVINSVVLQDAIESQGTQCHLYTAKMVSGIGEVFNARYANHDLDNNRIIVCAGGTGNPYFTTDTAAVLRAIECNCDYVIKCTNVDYVYDKDPRKHNDARPIQQTTFDKVITQNLRVMDQTAFALARDNDKKIAVCHINELDQLAQFDEKSFKGTIIN